MNKEGFKEGLKNYAIQTGKKLLENERVRQIAPPLAVETLRRVARLNVSGHENIARTRELLSTHSALITFNHLSIFDLLPIFIISQNGFGKGINYMFPAAAKFFDGSFENPFITEMIHSTARKYNLDLIETQQHGGHDPTRQGEVQTKEQQDKNQSMLKKILRTMQEPRNVLVMSPEGGRSRTGAMIHAGKRIDPFMRKNSILVPFAIWGTENIHQIGEKTIHPFAQMNVVVGEPMSREHVSHEAGFMGESMTTIAALHTARLLPEKYRGVYSEYRYPEFYNYYTVAEDPQDSLTYEIPVDNWPVFANMQSY